MLEIYLYLNEDLYLCHYHDVYHDIGHNLEHDLDHGKTRDGKEMSRYRSRSSYNNERKGNARQGKARKDIS
jgi:hypothetical protein